MADHKKACIVYVAEDGCDPSTTQTRLEAAGYEVTLCAVSREEATAAQEGEASKLPEDARLALEDAALCIILITECCDESSELAEAVNCVIGGGGDIVGVWPEGQEECDLPKVLIDYGCDVIPEGDPEFQDVIQGDRSSWKAPKEKPAPKATVTHQKKC